MLQERLKSCARTIEKTQIMVEKNGMGWYILREGKTRKNFNYS